MHLAQCLIRSVARCCPGFPSKTVSRASVSFGAISAPELLTTAVYKNPQDGLAGVSGAFLVWECSGKAELAGYLGALGGVVGERDIRYGLCLIPDCMDARAVQNSTQNEDPRPIELTLTTPRYPCRTFADQLREYRRERGWRQVDLAKALGVNKDTVRNWETARSIPRRAALGHKAIVVLQQVLDEAPGVAAAR